MRDGDTPAIDPVTVEIIRCGLLAITNEIDANICRTAYSPIVAEYKDYAVGILDPTGNLICQCTGGHEQGGEGEDIRADDPLDVREFAMQIAGDGGKRHGDDIRVEHDKEGGPGGA